MLRSQRNTGGEVPGADAVLGSEGPVEAGIVGKAAAPADLSCRLPGGEQMPGHEQSAHGDIPVHADPHLPGKGMGQVVFAYKKFLCQTFQG